MRQLPPFSGKIAERYAAGETMAELAATTTA